MLLRQTEMAVLPDDYNSFFYDSGQKGTFFAFDPQTNKVRFLYRCRVEFAMYAGGYHNSAYNFKWIGFKQENMDIGGIHEFLSIVEEKLNLKIRSEIHPMACRVTENNVVKREKKGILIKLSPFWTDGDNFVKMSLFTLFLRCGAMYYKDNFEKALLDYDLASKVIPAINHFLAGNTKTTLNTWVTPFRENGGMYYGFVGEFQDRTKKELSALLVKDDMRFYYME